MRKLSATSEKAKFIGGVLADTYFNKRRYYVHQVKVYSVIEIKITSALIYCLTVRNSNVTIFYNIYLHIASSWDLIGGNVEVITSGYLF